MSPLHDIPLTLQLNFNVGDEIFQLRHKCILQLIYIVGGYCSPCFFNSGKVYHPNVRVIHQEPESEEVDIPDMFMTNEGGATWFGLRTIDQLWSLLWKYQGERDHIRIVTGNTAYGIQPVQPMMERQTMMLYIGRIVHLTELISDDKSITARCSVTIQRLRDCVKSLAEAHKKEDERSSHPPSVAYEHWQRLATTEVRNVGSIGGNFYIARECEFPSDLLIVLITLGATVKIAGPTDDSHSIQERSMTIMEFLQEEGILDGANIIYEVKIPIAVRKNVFIRTYKVSHRPQNSHPIINGGFSVKVEENRFQDVCIVFGNIAKKICRMSTTEKWMQDNCTPTTLAKQLPQLLSVLEEELQSIVIPKKVTTEEFRVDTACNLFFKYLVKMACVFELPDWTDLRQVRLGIAHNLQV